MVTWGKMETFVDHSLTECRQKLRLHPHLRVERRGGSWKDKLSWVAKVMEQGKRNFSSILNLSLSFRGVRP